MATTTAEMLTLLNILIQNTGNNQSSLEATNLVLLNFAQDWTVGALPRKLLPELDTTSDTEKTIDSNSEYDTTSLTNTVWRHPLGIYSVRFTDGAYLRKLSQVELEQFTNARGGSSQANLFSKRDPKYYYNAKVLHVLPEITDGSETLDFKYIMKPSDIADGANCALQEGVQNLICVIAAAFYWLSDEKINMCREMLALATTKAAEIGVEFPDTESLYYDIQKYSQWNAGIFLTPGSTGAFYG